MVSSFHHTYNQIFCIMTFFWVFDGQNTFTFPLFIRIFSLVCPILDICETWIVISKCITVKWGRKGPFFLWPCMVADLSNSVSVAQRAR